MRNSKKRKPGPPPKIVKIEGNWRGAMAKMLRGGAATAETPKPKAKKK